MEAASLAAALERIDKRLELQPHLRVLMLR